MLKSIRYGVFETNSSSTHSITMVSKEDFEAWKKGELLFDSCSEEFVKNDETVECLDDFQTYDEYFEDDCLECFKDSYTTKNGDEVIAFGKYGYDN